MHLKRLCGLALSPLLVYALLAPPIAWPLYEIALFHPDQHVMDIDADVKGIERDFNASKEDVTFPSANGKMLSGWLFRLPKTKRVFLVSEGQGGNIYHKLSSARLLLQCGGSVFQYDYQGYGKSEGRPTLDGVCDDAAAAYDYLIKHEHRTGSDIIAFGESFGSGVTGQLAARRNVGGIILLSGYSSLLKASREMFPFLHLYPDWMFPTQRLDNVAVFQKPHPPLLIVHGKQDKVLSYQNAQALFNASAEPKTFLTLPEGSHGAFGKGNEFFTTVSAFCRQ
jgi:uncharacterized protein